MRTSTHFITAVATLASLTAAWPWPPSFEAGKAMENIEGILFRRQNNNNGGSQSSAAAPSNANTIRTLSNFQPTTASSRAGSAQNSTITSAPSAISGNNTNATATYTTEYDARLPAGGVSMITPNALLGATYYKIGDWVTFAWNYTSLSATPTAVNVMASCSANAALYTLASNMSVGQTNQVLWDTGEYAATASIPLLTSQYTLIIMDANANSITDTPKAGYLAVQRTFQFGMYLKQAYTPWSSYNCPTCNAAFGSHEKLTLSFLLGMLSLSLGSFFWFASGFGVF